MRIPKSVKKKIQAPSLKRKKIETLREACQEEYGNPPWEAEDILKVSKRLNRAKKKRKSK